MYQKYLLNVRAVSMSSTDGLQRGVEVIDTGAAIAVPVGTPTLGRIFNILGEPVDNGKDIEAETERLPIHREAPAFTDLDTKPAVFETGIKVVDLLAPYRRGGKIGLFRVFFVKHVTSFLTRVLLTQKSTHQ